MDFVRTKIAEIGLESDRVWMVNVSAAMGIQFAEEATRLTDKIQELGPNPLKSAVKTEKVGKKVTKHHEAGD